MFGRNIIAELAEIDENLVRSQLTPAQAATAIFRREAIYEELLPETKAGVAGGLARQGSANEKFAFTKSTADAIGKSRGGDRRSESARRSDRWQKIRSRCMCRDQAAKRDAH
jgi:hypothetical protein